MTNQVINVDKNTIPHRINTGNRLLMSQAVHRHLEHVWEMSISRVIRLDLGKMVGQIGSGTPTSDQKIVLLTKSYKLLDPGNRRIAS